MILSDKQRQLLKDYGSNQIKFMFEKDEAFITPPPKGSILVGISIPYGLPTALDEDNKIRYSYRGKSQGWVSATEYSNVMSFDPVTDLRIVYEYLKNET